MSGRYDWVSFTTDYGRSDGFVAACVGVIARIAPHVRVLDITHDIDAGDVRGGATVLAHTAAYLPAAVHLAVVDPGVGTARRGVAVVAGGNVLVGPDNGLLAPAADALGGVTAAYHLTERGFWLPAVSSTFHGRDVFAPVAAHLANGVDPAELGPEVAAADLVRRPEPVVHARAGRLAAQVLALDRFGNVQLTATRHDLAATGFVPGQELTVTVNGPPSNLPRAVPREPFIPDWPPPGDAPTERSPRPRRPPREPFVPEPPPPCRTATATVGHTFADVEPGQLVVLVDSAGRVAIAANGTSAARLLAVTAGTLVELRPA
ncbi:MAG TPA: SAM-dependent chlorinase/fluorinase [Pseudonocardiaceae bacterium]|nr:SAM-dependent chlorinase/fluorinase [Pseudonocardiaceae bacterium]